MISSSSLIGFLAKLGHLLLVYIHLLRILRQTPVAVCIYCSVYLKIQDDHRLLFFQVNLAFQICFFNQRIFKLIKKSIGNNKLKLVLSQFKAGKRNRKIS